MKKFLTISNSNAITYKKIFPLIKENKMWLGVNWVKNFNRPNGDVQKFGNVCWFTNLEHNKRHEHLTLVDSYNSEDYPSYDNYDAIEVSKTVHIPNDYEGVMGVPISFLDKYCPEQFEIIGHAHDLDGHGKSISQFEVNGKGIYTRILIRNKHIEK